MKGSTLAILGGFLLLLASLTGEGRSPVPAPKPDVVQVAPPFKADKLSVLIVEQTEDAGRLPKGQAAILQNSTRLRKWVKDADVAFLQLDADENGEFLDAKWKAALAVPRQSVPWIVIANARTGYSGPLPATVEETIALLERFES